MGWISTIVFIASLQFILNTNNSFVDETSVDTLPSINNLHFGIVRADGRVQIQQEWNKYYYIVGYEQPDTLSRKMILFTNPSREKEEMPNYWWGAYSTTGDLIFEEAQFTYKKSLDNYIEVDYTEEGRLVTKLYMESRWFTIFMKQ